MSAAALLQKLRELIKSIRRRGEALEDSDDDFMEALGAHYLGLADEIEDVIK